MFILAWLLALVLYSYNSTAQVKLFTNDELPTEHVYRILQDKEGYIWILTEEGIVKYNGTDTKTFTVKDGLPTNDVFDGYFTDNNQFWFICKGNELGYIENDSVYSYKLDKGSSMDYNGMRLRSNDVKYNERNCSKDFELVDGKWVSEEHTVHNSDLKVYLLNTESVYSAKQTTDETLTFRSKENDVLFAITDSVVTKAVNRYFNTYKNHLTVKLLSNIFFVNLNNYQITKLDLRRFNSDVLSINFINDQFQITGKNFVVKLNDAFEIEEEYWFDEKYNAHANLIDKEGNLWLGSFTTGVHYISKSAYLAELKDEEKDIRQGVASKSKLYYTDFAGIIEFNSNEYLLTKDIEFSPVAQEGKHFTTIAKLGSQLFVSLNYKPDRSNEFVEQTVNSEHVRMLEYPMMDILSYKNLIYVQSFNVSYIYTPKFLLKEERPGTYNCFIGHNNSLLYGNNSGLYFFETDSSYGNFTKPVKCAEFKDDKLYVGTNGYGLSILANGTEKEYPLEDAIVNDVLILGDSLVLCATNKGAICLTESGDSLLPYYIYDKKDGLISQNSNVIEIDAEDNLYIGTKKGILKTKLKTPHEVSSHTYPMLLDYLKWNNEVIKDSTYHFVNESGLNSLSIKFSSVKFSESEFYYKLNEGPFTKIDRGEITLTDLSPGDFKLTLKIKSPFSTEETKGLLFSIKPIWYKTNGFLLAVGFAILGLLFSIVRYNRRKKRDKTISKLKQQAELSDYKLHALRSQMNPHFVFNSLNAIQYYINENKNDLSEKYLVKFSALVRKIFDLSSQKDNSIKTEIELLNNYLEIEQMRFEDKLRYTITIDDQIDQATLIPTMALQPIVENAVNHGIFHKEEEGMVCVAFSKISDQEIEIVVTDDGVGFENSKSLKSASVYKHLSKSTLIFKERIDLLNNSDQWKISYSMDKLREYPTYPGTKTVITLERKR